MTASILYAIWLLGAAWTLFDYTDWLQFRSRITLTDRAQGLCCALGWPILFIAVAVDVLFLEDAEDQ